MNAQQAICAWLESDESEYPLVFVGHPKCPALYIERKGEGFMVRIGNKSKLTYRLATVMRIVRARGFHKSGWESE